MILPLNVSGVSLLFRRVLSKILRQSQFSIADQNTAIRELHLLFSPLFADGIPTCSPPRSEREYFSKNVNNDNHFQIVLAHFAIATFSFESGSIRHNLNQSPTLKCLFHRNSYATPKHAQYEMRSAVSHHVPTPKPHDSNSSRFPLQQPAFPIHWFSSENTLGE